MEVVFQSGSILKNPPMSKKDVDYAVIYSDTGEIALLIKTMDKHSVLVVQAGDELFDETIQLLGLDKNHTEVVSI